MMDFRKSSLQVNDLSELETSSLLETAIENASARREASIELMQTEIDRVHGGFTVASLPELPWSTGIIYRPDRDSLGKSKM
jgi:hypothetical protein